MLIPKLNDFYAQKLIAGCAVLIATQVFAADVPAADPATVALRQSLTKLYPNTKFGEVRRTPIAGLWEVWMGANVAYVTDEGRHFIFGHLYDMQTQTDLTAEKKEQASLQGEAKRLGLSFKDLPLQDAIKTVRGNGTRRLAVFSDPECPYCHKLEQQLAKLDNVTIYTFLFPIAELHPEAAGLAQSIWCADDRAMAWRDYMIGGQQPPKRSCDTPVNRTVDLAVSANINGTPFILFENGNKAAGAMSAELIEQRLVRN